MHDITLANDILHIALKEAKERKILRIKMQMIEDGHLTKETLTEAFKLVSKGTVAEGAALVISTVRYFMPSGGVSLPENKVLELEVEES